MTCHLDRTVKCGSGEIKVCVSCTCTKNDNSVTFCAIRSESAVSNSKVLYCTVSALAEANCILLYVKCGILNNNVVTVIEVDSANCVYCAVLNKNTVNTLELCKRVCSFSCSTINDLEILVATGIGLNTYSTGNIECTSANGYVACVTSVIVFSKLDASISGNAVCLEYKILNSQTCGSVCTRLSIYEKNTCKGLAVSVNSNGCVRLLSSYYITCYISNNVDNVIVLCSIKSSLKLINGRYNSIYVLGNNIPVSAVLNDLITISNPIRGIKSK